MAKKWLIGELIMSVLLLSACRPQAVKSNHHDAHSQQSTSEKMAVNKRSADISRSEYDLITIGDINNGYGGSTKSTVVKWFGSPAEISTVSINGVSRPVSQYSWKNRSASFKASQVAVQFLNGKAIGKSYTGSSTGNHHVVSKSKINQLGLGATYQAVVNQLGNPNSESDTGQGPMSGKYLTYVISQDGSAINLSFTDDKLNQKYHTSIYY